MSDQLAAEAAAYTTYIHKRRISMSLVAFEPTIPAIDLTHTARTPGRAQSLFTVSIISVTVRFVESV
jgi:hypothetical protein